MTQNKTPRPRASLDFSDFGNAETPSKPKAGLGVERKIAQKVAETEGFTSRQSTHKPKIDGRSLRATGRKDQLNIAVRSQTKEAFWFAAQSAGFTRGEEFLLALMEKWEGAK